MRESAWGQRIEEEHGGHKREWKKMKDGSSREHSRQKVENRERLQVNLKNVGKRARKAGRKDATKNKAELGVRD